MSSITNTLFIVEKTKKLKSKKWRKKVGWYWHLYILLKYRTRTGNKEQF